MGWKFNPFTGALDQTGSTPASYIDGEVATYNDLPLSSATAPLDTAWLVRGSSGVWPFTKPGGVYIRTATGGSSRDADYTYAGVFPDVFSDANFTLYDDADSTKTAKFQLSGISTGTTRTLTVPNASGRLQVEGQPIGNTTPSTGAFTTLSASGAITAAAGTAGTPTTPATALGVQWSGLGGTDIAAVYGTYAGAGKVGIGVGTSGILTEVASFALGGIALNRSVAANNGTLTSASAPVLDLSQTWNNAAVTFTGLRLNITDTASAAASNLLEIQVGGVTRMMLKKSGTLHLGQFTNSGFYTPAPAWHGSTAGLLAATNLAIGSSLDTILERGGAGIIEQRNLTNAQTYRIYNTYTDASNYERGFMRWSSNVLQIGTEKAGTGSARALEFQTDGASRWQITTAGILTTVSAPADSGGLTLQGGWMVYRAGTTNHWAIVSGDITQRATGNFQWSGQSDASNFSGDWLRLSRSAGGSLLLSAGTSTNHFFQFGGTTSSFPALKRSSTALQVRLADDSAYSVLDAQLRAQGTAPATSGATGTAGDIRYDADYIYICTAANTWKRAAIATW